MTAYLEQIITPMRPVVDVYHRVVHAVDRHHMRIASAHAHVSLSATIYVPSMPVDPTAPIPLCIFAHGFGETKSVYDRRATKMVMDGFVCCSYTVRGHGDSGGTVTAFAADEVDDMGTVTREVIHRLTRDYHIQVDHTSITGIGRSYGGGIAFRYASRPHTLLTSVVLESPLLSLESVLVNGVGRTDVPLLLSFVRSLTKVRLSPELTSLVDSLSSSDTDTDDIYRRIVDYDASTGPNMSSYFDTLRIPVLLIVSGADELVNPYVATHAILDWIASGQTGQTYTTSSAIYTNAGNHLFTSTLKWFVQENRVEYDHIMSWIKDYRSIPRFYTRIIKGTVETGLSASTVPNSKYRAVTAAKLSLDASASIYPMPLMFARLPILGNFLNRYWRSWTSTIPLCMLPLSTWVCAYHVMPPETGTFVTVGFPTVSFQLTTSTRFTAFTLYLVIYDTCGKGKVIGVLPCKYNRMYQAEYIPALAMTYGAHRIRPGFRFALILVKNDIQFRLPPFTESFTIRMDNVMVTISKR